VVGYSAPIYVDVPYYEQGYTGTTPTGYYQTPIICDAVVYRPAIVVTGVPVRPLRETVREAWLRRIAHEKERQRALRRLAAGHASRELQVAPRAEPSPLVGVRAVKAPALFGFEQRQRWGTHRGNRKAPHVPHRLAT
jgi:hypothetical protein